MYAPAPKSESGVAPIEVAAQFCAAELAAVAEMAKTNAMRGRGMTDMIATRVHG